MRVCHVKRHMEADRVRPRKWDAVAEKDAAVYSQRRYSAKSFIAVGVRTLKAKKRVGEKPTPESHFLHKECMDSPQKRAVFYFTK